MNSGIYCFTLAKLLPCLNALRPTNFHRELYLTDAIALLRQNNENVLAQIARDPGEILGCNTRANLADLDRVFRARKAAELMDAGVTIYLPETVLIDPEVDSRAGHAGRAGRATSGQDAHWCAVRDSHGQRGEGCSSGRRRDDRRAHACRFQPLCATKAQVGPFSRLRPGSDIRAGAHVGGFVEVKKSVVHEGAKVPHLSYIGDVTIGRESNIGAGTITCNYDGVGKYPTTIGNRVFIGSDTALVAPVRIGDGAYVAAGSIITENVPADALAIARGRQANKPGWAAARRAEQKRVAANAKSPKRSGKRSAKRKPGRKPARKKSHRAKSKSRR